jgi:hypothetical protein
MEGILNVVEDADGRPTERSDFAQRVSQAYAAGTDQRLEGPSGIR